MLESGTFQAQGLPTGTGTHLHASHRSRMTAFLSSLRRQRTNERGLGTWPCTQVLHSTDGQLRSYRLSAYRLLSGELPPPLPIIHSTRLSRLSSMIEEAAAAEVPLAAPYVARAEGADVYGLAHLKRVPAPFPVVVPPRCGARGPRECPLDLLRPVVPLSCSRARFFRPSA